MKRKLSIKNTILCLLFFLAVFTASAESNVLVIHSYHGGVDWTAQLIDGLDSTLSRLPDTRLFHEYLDAKHFWDKKYELDFLDSLKSKYSAELPDLIIVTGDSALILALNHRNDFYSDVPLLFLGVDEVAQDLIDMPGITGIFEHRDLTPTLVEIKKITGSNELIVIGDGSLRGKANLKKIEDAVAFPGVPSRIHIIPELTSDNIGEALSSYDPAIPILQVGRIIGSRNGGLIGWNRSSKMISRSLGSPLFTLVHSTLNYGAVGADSLMPFPLGSHGADMAVKILTGTPVDSIHPITEGRSQWAFDWNKIEDMGLDKRDLPPGSIIKNDERGFYQKWNRLVWLVGGAFGIAVLIIGLLTALFRKEMMARALLEENEKRYTDLARAGSMIFWESDKNHSITHISGSTGLLLDKGFKDLDKAQFFDLINGKPGMQFPQDELENLVENRQIISNLSFEVHNPSQEIRYYQLNGTPHYDEGGEFSGYRGICKEVTEERELRTRLEHSQRMDAIGQLAGGVAHDFNNILAGVISSSELLRSHIYKNEKALAINDLIIQTCEGASQLPLQLMAFSRKQKVSFSSVKLSEVIEDSLILLNRTLDKRIDIERSEEETGCLIRGNAFLIKNIIVNLCINASHAMPEGGSLRLISRETLIDDEYCRSSSFDLSPGSYAEFLVEDTGIGIPREQLSRIFEPFFTTKERSKGTGLGLSAVYGTVVQHGGEITVESEQGKGTVFRLLFPLAEAPSESAETKSKEDLKGSGTILLAEDDEVLRFGESKILRSLGYSVIVAKDGLEAVKKYRENSSFIDLAILDMIMPVMDGKQCFEELRKENPSLPIILISGCDYEELEVLKEDRLNAYISKPFRKEELGLVVKRVLLSG